MSIADKITRLTTARSNISTAITNKGGTVESGAGFEDFSNAIATIPTGSGVQPDIAFNADRSTVTFKNGITKIPDGCCFRSNLTSMPTMPASVTEIGEYAFSDTQMDNIVIPASVREIGNYAFSNNTWVQNIVIPANVSFGSNVFNSSHKLKSITFATGFNLTEMPESMFNNCGDSNEPLDIVLPDSVTKISYSAFSNCYIKSINLDNITIIDSYAFSNNGFRGIETLELKSIDILDNYAFSGNWNNGLKEVRIHTTPSTIGYSVFENCNDLTDIYVPWSSGTHSDFDSGLTDSNNATIHYDTVWYDIEATVVNGDINGVPADVMSSKQYTFTITPNAGYMLPAQITVSGATYTYDSSAGTITLTAISGDVSISVSCPTVSVTAITPVVTNGTGVASAQTIGYDDTATVTFTPGDGYYQPYFVTVAGAEYTYDRTLGTVTLTHPYASTITVTAKCDEYEYADVYTVVIPQDKAEVELWTYTEGGFGTIYWGDGTSRQISGDWGGIYKAYSSAGTYNILYVSDDGGEGKGLTFSEGNLGEYVTRITFAENRKIGVRCPACKQIKEIYIPKSIVEMNDSDMFPDNIEKVIFEDASTLTDISSWFIQRNNDNVEVFTNASYDSLLWSLKNTGSGQKVLHCTDGDYYWVKFNTRYQDMGSSYQYETFKVGETATKTIFVDNSAKYDFDENNVSFINCSGSYVVSQDLKQMEITVGNYTGRGLVDTNAIYHIYNITASTIGGTGVLSADTISYKDSYDSVTYTVTPITGYIPQSVSCTGADAELVANVVTITNPTDDVVLSVTCIEDADRTITTTVTNGTFTQSAQTMRYNDTVTVSITPDDGYYQPTDVIVTNAMGSWDRYTGTLTITKAVGNVTVTAECPDTNGVVLDASWLYNHRLGSLHGISDFELIDDDYISYNTYNGDPYWYFETENADILNGNTLKYRYCDITYKSDISGSSEATLYLLAVGGGNSTSYDFVGDDEWHTLTIDTQNNPYRTQIEDRIRVDIPDNGDAIGNVCIKELHFY